MIQQQQCLSQLLLKEMENSTRFIKHRLKKTKQHTNKQTSTKTGKNMKQLTFDKSKQCLRYSFLKRTSSQECRATGSKYATCQTIERYGPIKTGRATDI